jgi:predicted PurR-regulated permease PerM
VNPGLKALRQIQAREEIIQLAIRIGLLALLVYWSFVLVRPFVPILVWSVVLAVALYPFFTWLSKHLGDRPRTAAILITLVNLSIVLGPVAWLGIGLIDGLRSISEQLGAGSLSIPSPPRASEIGRWSANRYMSFGTRHRPTSRPPSGNWLRTSSLWPVWFSHSRAVPVSEPSNLSRR